MKQSEYMPDETWVDERIEAYVDGDLTPEDAAWLESALALGQGRDEVYLARRIRSGLQAMPEPLCPPHVIDSVLQQARIDAQRSRWGRVESWMQRWWGEALRPALAMAVLVLLVVSAALVGRPTQEVTISDANVEQALAEAKRALALVSRAGRQTGTSVRSDVLEPHVIQPVRSALGTVLDGEPEMR